MRSTQPAGGDATSLVVDVTKEDDIAAMVRLAVDTYGKLDIVFNNAGTEGIFAPLVEQNKERFDMVFEPNVRGVFNSMKYEAEVMLKQGFGSIINNASTGGRDRLRKRVTLYWHEACGGRNHEDGIDRMVQARRARQCPVSGAD